MKSWKETCLDWGIGYVASLKGNIGAITTFPVRHH